MPNLQLANGTTVKDVLVWDGTKWISRLVYIRTSNGWEECFRPTQFVDTFTNVTGGTRRSTTGLISGGLKFATNVSYNVKSNILPIFSDWTILHADLTRTGDYSAEINATATQKWSYANFDVEVGKTYKLTVDVSNVWVIIRQFNDDGSTNITNTSTTITSGVREFTFTAVTTRLSIRVSPSSSFTGTSLINSMYLEKTT